MKADERQRIEALLAAWDEFEGANRFMVRYENDLGEDVCSFCHADEAHYAHCEYFNLQRAVMRLPYAQTYQRSG